MADVQSYPFWLGGIGASSAAVCTHPLDVTKVRMQTMLASAQTKRPTMFSVIRSSIAEAGVRSLYTGLSASLLRQMTYSLVRLGSFEPIKASLSSDGPPSPATTFLAAMLAGALGGMAGNPADVVFVRMTSDLTRPPEQRYGYSNAFTGVASLVKAEGPMGLARGLGTNLTRAILMNGSQVGSYDLFKRYLLSHPVPILEYQFHDNLLCHIAASILAGTVATTVCSPADVMRSRLMSAPGDASPIAILKESLRNEGPRFLFKGWTPAWIRLGPNTVLMFVFYELLSRGGAKFDKKRFSKDVQLFKGRGLQDKGKEVVRDNGRDLPTELDFFKYAPGETAKRKGNVSHLDADGRTSKKVKTDVTHEQNEEAGGSSGPSVPRQRVTAKGANVPEAIESFHDLKSRFDLSSHLLANLERSGFEYPTGIQAHGIPILMETWLHISPTGTGKTLAYLLPIISSLGTPASSNAAAATGVRAVILAPTRELAHQIHNECLKLAQGRKWKIVLFSKATASTLSDKNVRDKVDIIISTPLRLVSSLKSGAVELGNVRHLILDEADRLLDSEFLDQVHEVVSSCTHSSIQKAVFSATLPSGVEKIAMDMLDDPIRVVVGLKDTPLPLIAQSLTYVADDFSKLPTLQQYFAQPYDPPVLIFVSSQDRVASLAEELVLSGIPNVDHLHAGMTNKEREDAVSRMRQGQSWVMVTTEVMARGMDFKGVREVINYDFPQSVQSYIHRVGRTGRMGREGKATTFFTNDDGPFLKMIANVILQSGSSVPDWITKLPKPSKMKRRAMGKVKRADVVTNAHRIGKGDAVKKREMIAGSKRRKEKATETQDVAGELSP
ncbi:hypothetical protein NLI96_g8549 [Meripilus lineatus]|uniref:RNA helicase n=1 Tax=Meripilus lineatus TaxID=2056292 RepID=A0AAD5UZE2_9APHY|nr:hypothetical protein NLI96_g8549 [Physisporinus lineatus]